MVRRYTEPVGSALASLGDRRISLSPARRRRLLGPPIPEGIDFHTELRTWLGIGGALTVLLMALGIPAALEIDGWLAFAFVFLPGPTVATTVTTLRVISTRNPEVRAYARRLEKARSRAAAALRKELAALEGTTVEVDEHALDVRRAWLVTDDDRTAAWVLVGDERALILGGPLPSTQLTPQLEQVPRRWSVERLPHTGALLGVRAFGPAVRLQRVRRFPDVELGTCQVVAVEDIPVHLAEMTVGVSSPYRA